MTHFILGTAGHVDHGKTALIKALTGTETDRLPEEKKRGITIELGFAHLVLPGLSIGVVDVPGHEDFVRNMIAGVGSIDLALLAVAADDGWMPQTEEHFQILTYLGVTRLVVALTKCDLAQAAARRAEIREQLEGTTFAAAPIVETSVRDESGLALLRETLAAEFGKLAGRRDNGKPRLFVDRVFSMRGSGTVVTGTLNGGRLERGATVRVLPENLLSRIRTLQSHNQALEIAEPGTRTALNLADVSATDLARGAIVALPQAGEPSAVLDVLLQRSPRLPPAARPLKSGSTLNLHHGSRRIAARVQLRDRKELLPNEQTIARLRLSDPVLAFVGDRFILRDSSGQSTLAGGLVLDPEPAVKKFRALPQRQLLERRRESPNDCPVLLETELQRDHFARRRDLLLKSPFHPEEIVRGLETLQAEGRIFLSEKIAADKKWWSSILEAAGKLVEAEHRAHPEAAGLDVGRLREGLGLADEEVFEALRRRLLEKGFSQTGNLFQRASHRPALPPHLLAAGDRIRATLRARPLDPPSRKELAPDAAGSQALRFLCESGEAISLGEEVVLLAEVSARLKNLIVQSLREKKTASASELRQITGTTRRVLIPLLEHCDRIGLTLREGDRRRLRCSRGR